MLELKPIFLAGICFGAGLIHALSGASASTQYLQSKSPHRAFTYIQYEAQDIEENLTSSEDAQVRHASPGNFNLNFQYEYMFPNRLAFGVSASPLWPIVMGTSKGNLLGYLRYSTPIFNSYCLQTAVGSSYGFRPYFGLHISREWENEAALAAGLEYYSGTNMIWSPVQQKPGAQKNETFPFNHYTYEHYYRELRFPISVQWRFLMISFAPILVLRNNTTTSARLAEESDYRYGLNDVTIKRKFEIRAQWIETE